MIKYLIGICIMLVTSSCILSNRNQHNVDNKELSALFDKYYEEQMQLFPLEATQNGDNRYNDKLYADFTATYREKLHEFYNNFLTYITHFERQYLNENDRISYDIFKREMEMRIEGLGFHNNYFPCNQFWGLPLDMGQMATGEGLQPFKTVKDYENWLKRINAFSVWADSAVLYFKKGMASNEVLPQALVAKMIPQMKAMLEVDIVKHQFYTPILHFPTSFTKEDQTRLADLYKKAITEQVIPSYKKLSSFLEQEYLPKARLTSGIDSIPNGMEYYKYLIRYWTTTDKTPDEILNIGLSEVNRIKAEMEKVKNQVGFKGDLHAFFHFIKTDKQFMPYKKPEEVLDAFHKIKAIIDPQLTKLFGKTPKCKFEIRQTEAFRAASASAEYSQGTADGSRPGIFYIPIVDATKFNVTSGMENLFLHEAIPGHHYQISLQQENEKLPKFRRFSWYGAYGEGWALYCESLGHELGLYKDPNQYMGALGDEMLRAVRLVVDVSIHTKGMSRKAAIEYMFDNLGEDYTAEVERYMAIPGQALSYKIGALKIKELKAKYQQQLGSKFNAAAFHDEFLKDGCMPLDVLETKMNDWASKQ